MNYGRLHQISTEALLSMMEVNMIALTILQEKFYKKVKASGDKQRRYALLNVSSIAGEGPMAYNASYAATKAYVNNFTEGIAFEASTDVPNLDVNCLTPSTTYTGLIEGVNQGAVLETILGLKASTVARASLGRLGDGKVVNGGHLSHDS
jgi:short-subunit dehydrogenase